MAIDGYPAAEIDKCQCVLHTDRVARPSVAEIQTLPAGIEASPTGTEAARPIGTEVPGPAGRQACCTPLLREPISASQAADLARLLKALADPTRLRLVSMVAAHEGGEACVCELTEPLGLTQPTISHHLKILVDAGIFTRDKRGVWAYYALVPAAMDALAAILSSTA